MSLTNNQRATAWRLLSWECRRPGGEWMGKGFISKLAGETSVVARL
jgi:hypothetical protein